MLNPTKLALQRDSTLILVLKEKKATLVLQELFSEAQLILSRIYDLSQKAFQEMKENFHLP